MRGSTVLRELRQIIHCDIIFNFRYHEFTINPEESLYGPKDFTSIALHELGHALGLEHDPDPTSVMFPALRSGEVKRTLSNSDKFYLKTLYEQPDPVPSRAPASFDHPYLPRNRFKVRTIRNTFMLDANGQCKHYQSSLQ